MSMRRITTIIAFLAFTALGATRARAYDALIVFGDSYNDVGNIFIATLGADPAPPYYNGRFSNGPIWLDHIASHWGLPLKPSLAGGTDYAFGGAEVTQDIVTPEGAIPSVPHQVAAYLLAHGGKADPNALYVIEGGGNDIVNNLTSSGTSKLPGEIAAGLAGAEVALREAGAKNFIIPDLFDVGLLPAAAANPQLASQQSLEVDAALKALLAHDQALQGIAIVRLSAYQLLTGIFVDQSHFGFTNLITPCLDPVKHMVCADPAHTLFWDDFHPTVFGHSFIAVLVESRLSGR